MPFVHLSYKVLTKTLVTQKYLDQELPRLAFNREKERDDLLKPQILTKHIWPSQNSFHSFLFPFSLTDSQFPLSSLHVGAEREKRVEKKKTSSSPSYHQPRVKADLAMVIPQNLPISSSLNHEWERDKKAILGDEETEETWTEGEGSGQPAFFSACLNHGGIKKVSQLLARFVAEK